MEDEPNTSTAVADATDEPATSQASQGAESPPADRDLGVVLEELDRILQANPDAKKDLRAHRTLMGIAGSMAQTIAQNMKREDDTKAQREAMANLEQQMIHDAETDPEAFAEKWLKGQQAARTRRELDQMRDSVEAELGENIGKAVTSLPEFKELSPEEVQRIAAEVAGKPKSEVLAAYARATVEAVAGKRAAKEVAKWRESELEKEVQARLKEANAKRLKKEQAPSIKGGTAAPVSTEPPYDPKPGSDWNKWYQRKYRVGPL